MLGLSPPGRCVDMARSNPIISYQHSRKRFTVILDASQVSDEAVELVRQLRASHPTGGLLVAGRIIKAVVR
jgi:hypothetical protein